MTGLYSPWKTTLQPSRISHRYFRKTVFVTVDREENVDIYSKANFKVMHNGKGSSMLARNVKEALRVFLGALSFLLKKPTSFNRQVKRETAPGPSPYNRPAGLNKETGSKLIPAGIKCSYPAQSL